MFWVRFFQISTCKHYKVKRMKTGTCHNTEKQVFTVPYRLLVPVNDVDRWGHRMGARSGNRPRGGGNHPYMCVAQAYV